MKFYIVVTVICSVICHGYALIEEREDRMFSLFNVVKFKNSACQSTETTALQGVCYTAQECSDKGGSEQGNCASGFGVCCIISVATCGGTVTQNCSYIENPNFPAAHTGTGGCAYTVSRCSDDICQVRLDFTQAVLSQPTAATGACDTDTLVFVSGVTVPLPMNPPELCGTLTGQHVYMDGGSGSTVATVTFTTPVATTNQRWRVKVSQLECSSPTRAPNGCLQYFTGTTNTMNSFNWDGTATCATGCSLINQDYSICHRQERGMCGINYVQSPVTTGDSFDLLTGANANNLNGRDATNAAQCGVANSAYLHIPSGTNPNAQDTYCGDTLSQFTANAMTAANQAVIAGWVNSSEAPFTVRYVTIGNQDSVAGFSLQSTQVPCNQPFTGTSTSQL